MTEELRWFDKGLGFYPANPKGVYGDDYFAKYEGYARTDLGRLINEHRVRLVVGNWAERFGPVVDVGIGCGQFVASLLERPDFRQPRQLAYGTDINLRGLQWLRDRGAEWTEERMPNACFWDSLEHFESPGHIIRKVEAFAFVSMPIFQDREHVLRSKHFRPDEHYWYWTEKGLVDWFDGHGFNCLIRSDMETKLGREDIMSFVFKRRYAKP